MKQNRLIAYAMDFASFLMERLEPVKVNSIILFGSVARGDYDKISDVDIFVDIEEKSLSNNFLQNIIEDFYKSIKFEKYWKLLGITNPISCKAGILDEWELKRSILAHGIVLYGPYKGKTGTHYVLFLIEVEGPRKEQVRVWRKLYGYRQKTKQKTYISPGIVQENGGQKLSPASFLVPGINVQSVVDFLINNQVKYRMMDIWTDSFNL